MTAVAGNVRRVAGRDDAAGAPQLANPAALEAVFCLIEGAAVSNERCPGGAKIIEHLRARKIRTLCSDRGDVSMLTTLLARDGRIRLLIYAHNWRVAEILVGPHAGKQTKAPPRPWAPYLSIGRTTRRLT